MLIVAIAWTYVVMMIALTENSFIAGLMDVLLYLLLPLGCVLYLQRSKMRRLRAEQRARTAHLEGGATQADAAAQEKPAEPQS